MEGKDGEPIDFGRALSQVKADTPNVTVPGVAVPAAAAPLPAQLKEMLTQRLRLRGLVADSSDYSGKFVESLEKFVVEQVLHCEASAAVALVIMHMLYHVVSL